MADNTDTSSETTRQRAEAVESDRQARAIELAVAAARKEARVDQILEGHGRDLNSFGDMLRKNTAELGHVSEGLEKVQTDLKTRDAVHVALIDAGTSRGQRKLTRLQTVGLIIGVLVAVGGFLLPLIQALHG